MKLELTDVTHGFDGRPVLEAASLSVGHGEVVAIIGPSGAGKSTFLRLGSLFEPPDGGTVTFDGVDPWAQSDRGRLETRRRIGVVFQQASLFGTTVERNVDAGLRMRRDRRRRLADFVRRTGSQTPLVRRFVDTTGTDDRIERALSIVGLTDRRSSPVDSLSGGEAQRVAFARAIAYDPDLLVLDEPTSDLDPRNTAILEHAVDRASESGCSVLLATHDMHQARRVADRIGVLIDGQLIEVGPTARIFDAPADPRTARFVDGDLLYDVEDDDLAPVDTPSES